MTHIIDYGVGNLFSLRSSFAKIGEETVLCADPDGLREAERILLPGVGAFSDAAARLRASGMADALTDRVRAGTPVLGICLGMQLLFDKSFEYGEHPGLGLIPGEIRPLAPLVDGLKVPHMGWNALRLTRPEHPLLQNVRAGDCVYFVHSYAAFDCDPSVIATAEYGIPVTAAVACKNVLGCQFHPEKSGSVGLGILRAFCALKEGDLC